MSGDVVGLLMDAAGRQPIPSRDEQLHLARLIQTGLAPDATPRQVRAGDRARQRLVAGNARLAVSIARTYIRRLPHGSSAMAYEDLIQEGMLGLDRAARKFDPERGFSFSTYATWWCRQTIARSIETQARMIRMPTSALVLVRRWRYKPVDQTMAEFCDAFGYDEALVLRTLQAAATTETRSLDAQVQHGDGDGAALVDLIAGEGEDPLAHFDEALAVAALEAARPVELGLLERSVVLGQKGHAIAAEEGISRAAVNKRLQNARQRLAVVAGDQIRELVA